MKRTIRTPWAPGLVVTAAALALAGCGNPGMSGTGPQTTAAPPASEQSTSAPAATSGPSSSPTSSAAAAPAEIRIKGFKYLGTETVSPGAKITVTNEDIEAHTITADTGTAFAATIQVGTGTFTAPTEPGTYPYHCNFHGNMKSTLTVK